MATRAVTHVVTENGLLVCTWLGIQENGGVFDDGNPVTVGDVEGLCVQGVGNFDTSFTVQMRGSNDGVTYFQLKNRAGTDVILAAAALFFDIPDRPRFIKPQGAVAGAADASDVNVILVGAQRR